MRFAITGAAGQIGHRLAHQLDREGHQVSALIRSEDRKRVLPEDIDITVGDVRRKSDVDQLLKHCNGVAHLAYGGGGLKKSVDIGGTKTVFESAKKNSCRTFVFTSSITEHPDMIEDSTEESKLKADKYISKNSGDLFRLVLYPTGVIGPGDYKMKKLSPYATVVSNKVIIPPLYRFGYQNYVHVDTVVESIIAGLKQDCTGNKVVCGKNLTDREYFSMIADCSPRNHYVPKLPLIKKVLPKVMSILAKFGLVPKKNYNEMNLTENSVSVPESWEDQSPVQNKGTKKAVKESIEWYQKAGII